MGPVNFDVVADVHKFIDAGVDIFRMNFSHDTHVEQLHRFNLVKEAREH